MSQVIHWGMATVKSISDAATEVSVIELVPDDGTVPYDPGSHVDVTVHVRGQPQTRSYSLVGEVNEGCYRIAVRHLPAGRGGSSYMANLSEGDRLLISQPKNHFQLNLAATSYLLVAGGIGITPIFAMAKALVAQGADLRLLYVGRTRASMPFLIELSDLLGDRLTVHADDEQGFVSLPQYLDALVSNGELYACGPTPMLDALRSEWQKSGRAMPMLRFESFGANGKLPAQPFVVKIPRLEMEFVVPADRTMLEALEVEGAEPIFNCRRGECGLCVVDVLSSTAEIDHGDVFFSEEQKHLGDRMCACVSRLAGGSVTINLP